MDNDIINFDQAQKNEFENQINNEEILKTNTFNNQNYQQMAPPQNNQLNKFNKKSITKKLSLIFAIVSVVLIILTFLMPWYCISFGMSFFFMSVEADMNFNLDKVTIDGGMGNESEHMSHSYNELENEAVKQGKDPSKGFFNLFENMTILVIIVLILSLISFIGVLGANFDLKNKKMMKKIGLIFGILTFIFGIITAGYFMVQWGPGSLNQMPDLGGDDSSDDESVDVISSEEMYSDLGKLGFWDSITYNADVPVTSSDNSSLSIAEGFFSSLGGIGLNIGLGPGLSWYIIIYASIMSLFSALILLNKKIMLVTITILVCISLLTGAFIYLSLFVAAKDSSSSSPFGSSLWSDESDPVEMAKFIGTWKIDPIKTQNYSSWGSTLNETWTFWENESSNQYKVQYGYYFGGEGSMSCTWSVNNNVVNLCYSTYSYSFSNNNMVVTLTKDDEKIVLNKIIG